MVAMFAVGNELNSSSAGVAFRARVIGRRTTFVRPYKFPTTLQLSGVMNEAPMKSTYKMQAFEDNEA